MSDLDLLTPELAGRLEKLLDELRATPCTGQEAARLAKAGGVGIVDASRRAFLVDTTVHEGVLFRLERWRRLAEAREPVPMILFCPRCGLRHIDQADPANGWLNEPHRSHLCAGCGLIWRPADIATVGVAAIGTRGRLDVDLPSHAGGPPPIARPLETWHEDIGPVLWWQFPVAEPPYSGTPLDSGWPGYHSHWTPIVVPAAPASTAKAA